MKAICFATMLLAFFTGCKTHSSPAVHGILILNNTVGLHPLPPGRYDARFVCDGLGPQDYFVSASFYDDSTSFHIPKATTVTVNGDTLKQGISERVHVHFPEPITWRIESKGPYPSFTHTIQPDSAIEFLSPNDRDSISLSQGFEVRYHAPHGIDTVLFHMAYFGKGVYKHKPAYKTDTVERVQETGQSYYYKTANTGRYVISPFKMFESFRSFDPRSFMVQIMWAQGDSVHVGDYVYGFETERYCTRNFQLKP